MYSEAWNCVKCGVRLDHDHATNYFGEDFSWSYSNSSEWYSGKPAESCEEILMDEALS